MVVHNKIKTEGPSAMLHFAIWVFVFIVLLAVAGKFYRQILQTTELAEAETAIQSYAASLINIHKEWIMQGKPNKVVIKDFNTKGEPGNNWVILMNRDGWPINVIDGTDRPDCKALWFALQKANRLAFTTRLEKMKKLTSGELVAMPFNPDLEQMERSGIWVCQNIVAKELHFRYRLDTGKVEILE